ncbi:MAG: hypothetical protein IKP40_09105 [Clostridia bacterium]|nr:hypothetical protein [Clostridia bacterium]
MSTASQVVKMALAKADMKQKDLIPLFGESRSLQSINNKVRLDRWFANDLALVAEMTGGKLAFVYPDGQMMFIDPKQTESVKGAGE